MNGLKRKLEVSASSRRDLGTRDSLERCCKSNSTASGNSSRQSNTTIRQIPEQETSFEAAFYLPSQRAPCGVHGLGGHGSQADRIKNKKTARKKSGGQGYMVERPLLMGRGPLISKETRRHGRLGQGHWNSEICPRTGLKTRIF